MSLICIFAYVCMPLSTCHWLYLCTYRPHAAAALPQPAASLPSRPSFPAVLTWFHLFATVWLEVTRPMLCSNSAAILRHFEVTLCWINTHSAVNLGETPSSEFVQYVLWLIQLTKTVESIYCAIRHTVTLPRVVWRMICWPYTLISSFDCYDVWRQPSPTVRRDVARILSLGKLKPMASAEREPIPGVWGQSLQRGSGAEPLVGG